MQNMSFDERNDGENGNDGKKDEFCYEPMGVTHADDAEFGDSSDDELCKGVEEVEDDDKLLEGDHVFVWQGFSQRHGIILESIHGSSSTRPNSTRPDGGPARLRRAGICWWPPWLSSR